MQVFFYNVFEIENTNDAFLARDFPSSVDLKLFLFISLMIPIFYFYPSNFISSFVFAATIMPQSTNYWLGKLALIWESWRKNVDAITRTHLVRFTSIRSNKKNYNLVFESHLTQLSCWSLRIVSPRTHLPEVLRSLRTSSGDLVRYILVTTLFTPSPNPFFVLTGNIIVSSYSVHRNVISVV